MYTYYFYIDLPQEGRGEMEKLSIGGVYTMDSFSNSGLTLTGFEPQAPPLSFETVAITT